MAVHLIGFLQLKCLPHLQNSQQAMPFALHGKTLDLARFKQLQGIGQYKQMQH